MTNKKVFVIIPAYNESKVIRKVVLEVLQKYKNVIVVDDGSTDNLIKTIDDLDIVILRHIINLGKGAAIKTGVNFAIKNNADIVVTFDADGQHKVDDIEKLVYKILFEGYDIVFGSRYLGNTKNMPLIRKFFIRLVSLCLSLIYGKTITDSQCGLKAFSVAAFKKINLKQNRYAFDIEIFEETVKNNLKFCEVPIEIIYTNYSLKKGQNLVESINILIDYLRRKLWG